MRLLVRVPFLNSISIVSSTSSSISFITPQLFKSIIHRNILGVILFLFFVMTSFPIEKIDSEGPKEAGIAR